MIELLALIAISGFAARFMSDLVLRHESLTDPICGYIRAKDGSVESVDAKKESSVFCTWALCYFCQSGWFSLYSLGLLWFMMGRSWDIPMFVLAWAASWRLAASLPE